MRLKPIRCSFIATIKLLVLLGLGFCFSTFDATSQAQGSSGKIIFSRESVSLKEVFEQIEKQSGYKFAYTASDLDTGKTIRLKKKEYGLREILDLAIKGTRHTYEIRDVHIIILDVRDKKPEPETQTGTKQTTQTAVKPAANKPAAPVKISDDELKKFTSDDARHEGTTEYYTSQTTYNKNIGDAAFPVPGKVAIPARIPAQFKSPSADGLPSVALKTNLLYGGVTLTPNIRLEVALKGRVDKTLDLAGSYNGWNWKGTAGDNRKLVHMLYYAEYRHWFCERFNEHFVGAHAFFSQYNVGGYDVPLLFSKDYRYEGYIFGAGVSYGYSMPIAMRWNVEFNFGIGVGFLKDDVWGCDVCDYLDHRRSKIYLGPTRIGVTIAYMLW